MSNNSVIQKKKRKAISLETKIQILDRFATGEGSTSIGKYFGLNEGTVRSIKKNEQAIRKSVFSGTKLAAKSSSYTRNILKVKMEKDLVMWIEYCSQKRIPIDGNVIKHKALQLYRQIQEKEQTTSCNNIYFSASTGWLSKFIERYALHSVKVKEAATSTEEPIAKEFLPKLSKIIEDGGYSADQNRNANKSVLFMKRMPSRTYLAKSQKSVGSYKVGKEKCMVHNVISAEIIEAVPENPNEKEISDEKLRLTSGLIKEGLQMANKLQQHFLTHDPITERAEQFNRELKSCMARYEELYKDLVKPGS